MISLGLWVPFILVLVVAADGQRAVTGTVALLGIYLLVAQVFGDFDLEIAEVVLGAALVVFSVSGALLDDTSGLALGLGSVVIALVAGSVVVWKRTS